MDFDKLTEIFDDRGLNTAWEGYPLLPFNFLSTGDRLGVRVFAVKKVESIPRLTVSMGIGKVFPVKANGLEAANQAAYRYTQSAIAAIAHWGEKCGIAMRDVNAIGADIELRQDERLARAIESVLAQQALSVVSQDSDIPTFTAWVCTIFLTWDAQAISNP